MYTVITEKELWDHIKNNPPDPNKGYMFGSDKKIRSIDYDHRVDKHGHSGATFTYSMRIMQQISEIGYENFVDEYNKNVASVEVEVETEVKVETEKEVPVTAPPPAIAGGEYHSMALEYDGTVVSWGLNDDGQSTVPDGLNNVIAIACGSFHSMALMSNGTVVCWGNNDYGQSTVPDGLSDVIAITCRS